MTNVFGLGFDDELHDICVVVYVLRYLQSIQRARILGLGELEDHFENAEEFQREAPILVRCMPRSSIPRLEPLLGILQYSKFHMKIRRLT